jgi:hypothetical protein
MKTYIGTKIVNATPMNRADYNEYRNWNLPENEDGADEGYLVEYTDGGRVNDSRHAGYISWSPKEQFEAAYKEVKVLTRSCVCMSCQSDHDARHCVPGNSNCNGYCRDEKIKSPATYEVPLFDFGEALRQLKLGKKVAREGWNGKGMWLVLVSGWNGRLTGTLKTSAFAMPPEWVGYANFIAMYTADKVLVPWLASQTDMLAEDWSIV